MGFRVNTLGGQPPSRVGVARRGTSVRSGWVSIKCLVLEHHAWLDHGGEQTTFRVGSRAPTPKLETISPKPETRNPKPETQNPKPAE